MLIWLVALIVLILLFGAAVVRGWAVGFLQCVLVICIITMACGLVREWFGQTVMWLGILVLVVAAILLPPAPPSSKRK